MKNALMLATVLGVLGTGVYAAPSFALETFPACTSDKVLRKLVKRFNQTEKIYWEERGLELQDVANPHNHATNPFEDSPINRHYCHGDAVFSDGRSHRIHYLIEEGAGLAGFTWNVEYCIHGLDPWRYYDGRCRVLSRGGHY
ncbi:MAG: hypothetical protein AAGA53_02740 [Pseudomonadota bacterium]